MFQSKFLGGSGIGPRGLPSRSSHVGLPRKVLLIALASILATVVLSSCSSMTADLSKEELAACFSHCIGDEQKNMNMDDALRKMGRIVGLGHMCRDAELVIKIGEDQEAQLVPLEKFSVGYGVDGYKYRAKICDVYVPRTKARGFVNRHKCRCEEDGHP